MSKVVRQQAPPPPQRARISAGAPTAFTDPDAQRLRGILHGQHDQQQLAGYLNQHNTIRRSWHFFLGRQLGASDGTTATWNSVITIDSNRQSAIDFGMTMYGLNIIGAHFGNAAKIGGRDNVSVFWLFDFGTSGGKLHDPRQYARLLERHPLYDR